MNAKGAIMMAVDNDKILQKMMTELQQARKLQDNDAAMLQHIQHIRLLCDLFLEEDETAMVKTFEKPSDMEEAELKAMLGEKAYGMQKGMQQEKKSQIDHDDANGSSIFDF
jgi:hypothetical protein